MRTMPSLIWVRLDPLAPPRRATVSSARDPSRICDAFRGGVLWHDRHWVGAETLEAWSVDPRYFWGPGTTDDGGALTLTPAAALEQAPRVARARETDAAELRALVLRSVEWSPFEAIGMAGINLVVLNQALDTMPHAAVNAPLGSVPG